MDKDTFIEALLTELSYRSNQGYPDFNDPEHIALLSEILDEWGVSELKNELINNLISEAPEEPETHFENPILNKEVEYEDADGNTKTGIVGNLLRQPKDTPPRDAADKALQGISDEERDEINRELGSEKDGDTDPDKDFGGKDDEESDAEGGEQGQEEPEMGTSLNPDSQSGQDYIDSLPDGDPAKKSAKEKSDSGDNPDYIRTETPTPQDNQISDANDELSDGEIKQKALDYGTGNTNKFKPAPGNKSSMAAEILSGEAFYHLNENPEMSTEELTENLYRQIEDTTLGKELGTKKKINKKGKYEGFNKDVYQLMQSIAKSGKKKFERTQNGIARLKESGKLTEPTTTRTYYGHEVSIQKQLDLIEKTSGPYYTREGVEIPEDDLTELIKNSGGGENPSDTATITVDKKGRAMVQFHSDKISTADIQANSTPNQEYENAKKLVEDSDLSGQVKEKANHIITQSQERLSSKEAELKTAATQPAKDMANGDISQILQDIKSDKGITSSAKVSTKLSSLTSRGKPHKNIRPYLPNDTEDYSDEDLLKAFYEYAGDDDVDHEDTMTGAQIKLLYRSANQQGYDISQILGKIREESVEIQRETLDKLNQNSVTLPNGDSKPLGDYIEAKNVVDKLHIGVIDDENAEGVGKYDGLFDVNMGGTIVEEKQLKHCLQSEDTDDFISHFEVGIPGEGDEYTRNRKTNEVTGRNVFVYAITKGGKKIKVAYKKERSKQGQSGKLNTTYQWDKTIQECFKDNQ